METGKKKLNKKLKALIAIVVMAVLIITGIVVVKTNETMVYTYGLYTLMPKTLTAEEINTDYDISVRLNKNFDAKAQDSQPLEAFEYYYTDPSTGKEVVIGGTESTDINGNEVPVYLGFVIKAQMNLNKLKSALTVLLVLFVVLLVVAAIVIWFLIWSKKEDEKKNKIVHKSKSKKGKR